MNRLTRVFSLLILTAVLVSAICGTAAAESAGDEYVPERIWNAEYDRNPFSVEQEDSGEVEYEVSYEGGFLTELEAELESADGTEYEVAYDGSGNVVRAEYETGDTEITYDGSVWTDESGNTTEGPDISFMKDYYDNFQLERQSYPNNTLSLIGLSLRDLYPQLTDKWYQVVPVDLTTDGVFTYKMAASNLYYMGICEVTVQDGKVTVDYKIPHGDIRIGKQCVAWFTNIGEITTEFLNDPSSDYRFGEPTDIKDEWKEQGTAILFVCNRVSYDMPLRGVNMFLREFWTNSEVLTAYRQELTDLLAKTE